MAAQVDLSESERLGPWWFRFEAVGQAFGGDVPRDTERVDTFFAWLARAGASVSTVLELGSHEGNHSLQLAEHDGITRVVGLEAREDNLDRARFVKGLYGAENVTFAQADLETTDLSQYGTFDAVFCAGLLYHLREPWDLIARVAKTARWLFLDTHYSATDAKVLACDYHGCWQHEGPDPLSGLSPFSFWLSFRQLVLILIDNGFAIRFVRDLDSPNGPRVWILAEQQD